ncbi:MAG: NAD(P)H-hydrate dehydratase [Slackia sp.]|nr:NAD(P)H-hydrate dehydratase [Slackia sp.]
MKRVTAKQAARILPVVRADANKYTRGVCELVVGSERFAGAAVLAAKAANRMGAGYVKVYACEQVAAALHIAQPSSVVLPAEEFSASSHEARIARPHAVVAGCGMAGTEDEVRLVLDVLDKTKACVLVDGGGLAALACDEGIAVLRRRAAAGLPTVITPHGGEAARLARFVAKRCGSRVDDSCADAPRTASDLARAFDAVCVLKGPDTFIATGNEESPDDVILMDRGTPALSKAGTGDILAGAIGSLLAQGCDPADACVAGSFVHARAGVLASRDIGEPCVTAEDVLDYLAPAIASLARKARKEGN